MFRKIAVAYNESAEAQRALASAIQLARSVNAELETITVMAELPSYTTFASAADPALPQVLKTDRIEFYDDLQERARVLARHNGLELQSHLVEGSAVDGIVKLLRAHKADLLVVGLHQRDLFIARLWSTVYELAQEAPCSVLGVH
ncbi:universal stress protein [Terriglobus saanensis]|uniref:UspA domain-containing protein n=1 Tax=Terriglobus saanensis (strain ATCC BAA-1853 / DSM 23119 / SP1PR4) TaxID=401053 RepID=E8V446_TERSS|nr:universal stress protein [Terriglobus saanensis]ADV82537.1 UspA domain-containing protein [Terriglobus saanensis SP1PR4]